jgi:hypothetical protein
VTILGALRLFGKDALLVPYLGMLPGLVMLFALIGSASHSCFLRRFKWIHQVLKTLLVTTPQEHLLHHTTSLHGNYGNFMTFWDRLCGTYLDPATADPGRLRLGLSYDQDFLGAVTGSWCKLPTRWRERCEVRSFCYITDTCRPRRTTQSPLNTQSQDCSAGSAGSALIVGDLGLTAETSRPVEDSTADSAGHLC